MLRVLAAGFLFLGSLAATVREAAGQDVPQGKITPVSLTVRELNPIDSPKQAGGLLVREIARQSFLIAARDECGLLTRDATLGEEIESSADSKSPAFVIVIASPEAELCDVNVTLRRGSDRESQPIWETTVEIPRWELIPRLVQKAEEWSRKDFKEALLHQGYAETIPPSRESAAVLEQVRKQLWEWNEIAVFTALRSLHAEIREKGESPELLADLAIGYVNLGLMTELRWSPAHKAFKARGLLYAERLLQKSGSTGWALAHRAYVRVLVGLHAAAAADAQNARERGAKPPEKPLPAWLAVIERTSAGKARPEVGGLTEPERSLACMLWLATADLGGLGSDLPRLVEPILQEHPDCFRVLDPLLGQRELGVTRVVTSQGLSILSSSLSRRLADISDLPEEIRKRLAEGRAGQAKDEIARLAAIIAGLKETGRAVGKSGEPSLTVLGNLIDDIAFQLAWRQLQLEKNLLGVSTDDDLPLLRPLGAHHPFGAFLDTFSDRREVRRTVVDKFRQVDWNELEFTETPLITWLCGTNKRRLERLRHVALSHTDPVYRDLMVRYRTGFLARSKDEKKNEQTARLLRSVSPQLPRVIALLVDIDWKGFEKQRLVLEHDFADVPNVLLTLAHKYEDLKQYSDAERCLRQVIRVQPTYANYRQLAAVYEQKKEMKRWQETLQESLKLPSLGLDRARVQADIAEYHLRHTELKEAFPFAEAAAASYSGWSLMTLARYYELSHDWKKAEEIVRAVVERYPTDSFLWMLWCRRTGRGDLHAAETLARQHFESLGAPAPVESLGQIATYYLLTGKPQRALAVFKRDYQRTQTPSAGLHAAVLADRLDNAAARDSLLTQLVVANSAEAPADVQAYAEVADAMRAALRDPNGLDSKRVEKAIQKTSPGQPTNIYYLVSMFLAKRGDADKSRTYLMRSATSPFYSLHSHVLAVSALRDHKVAIERPRVDEIVKP